MHHKFTTEEASSRHLITFLTRILNSPARTVLVLVYCNIVVFEASTNKSSIDLASLRMSNLSRESDTIMDLPALESDKMLLALDLVAGWQVDVIKAQPLWEDWPFTDPETTAQ